MRRNVVNAPPATPMIAVGHIALSSRAYAIRPYTLMSRPTNAYNDRAGQTLQTVSPDGGDATGDKLLAGGIYGCVPTALATT
jgi:hypothetical protein